jgi:protein gp37
MSTGVSWATEKWITVEGCSHESAGCGHSGKPVWCYAEYMEMLRCRKAGVEFVPWTAANAARNVRCLPEALREPFTWKKPQARVFVNDMADTFHALVPDAFIKQMFEVMVQCPRHQFLLLTKRIERAAALPGGPWSENIWLGTSVEDRKMLYRLEHLRNAPAAIKYLSFEPLKEDLGKVDFTGIHWVIVGGQSKPGYHDMDHAWAWSLYEQARAVGIAFYFKQSSALRAEQDIELIGPDGVGRIIREYPDVDRILGRPRQRSLFDLMAASGGAR